MNEAIIREKLLEISETLDSYEGLDTGSDGFYVPEKSSQVEAVIDHLRMQIKYLTFDLEASRRENLYLRRMLEIRPPQPRGKQEDNEQ
ncbi:MAG: hypothetical protein K8S55_06630 [Phycisphaerae bacterium]|nr:hypothetical protein [Phycisphaerae bacterium]